jgi:hypothetical protein
MEEGMARWGLDVPSADDEEEQRTQAALAFDDAEFQPDPEVDPKVESAAHTDANANANANANSNSDSDNHTAHSAHDAGSEMRLEA